MDCAPLLLFGVSNVGVTFHTGTVPPRTTISSSNQCQNFFKVVSNVSFVKVVYTRYLYTCIDKYMYMSYVPSIFVGGLSSSGTADFGVHKP